jgi:DeoR family transcriptional regulator, fructose operon transcriptional repressor
MSKSLIPAQRRERIQAYLAIHRIARLSDLSQFLDASEATIRRDLEWMENDGLIQRTHGGAMLSQHLELETEYQHRAQMYSEEKRLIGKMAASLVENGDTIFLNSGTTTTQIIRHLPVDADITVITNNLFAVLEAGEVGYELILVGGAFQPKLKSVAGRFSAGNLSQVYADKAFIGVDGINVKYGCTVPSITEAEHDRFMIERTHGKVFIVADHSKWGVIANFEIAQIDQIQAIITDSQLDPGAQTALRARGVEIVLADKPSKESRG